MNTLPATLPATRRRHWVAADMPGPCGGPGDGTNEGTKDGKCTKEGKRHGKGEHADKWCCTGNKCREALGVITSAAAKQAAAKPAAADEAVDEAAAAGTAAAGAAAAGTAAAGAAAAGAAAAGAAATGAAAAGHWWSRCGRSTASAHSDRSAAVCCSLRAVAQDDAGRARATMIQDDSWRLRRSVRDAGRPDARVLV